MFEIILTPEAEDELNEICRWYESERAGLGLELQEDLQKLKARILDAPFSFPPYYKTARKARMRRFQYCVFFTIRERTIYIFIIIHAHRNPRELRRRIRQRS